MCQLGSLGPFADALVARCFQQLWDYLTSSVCQKLHFSAFEAEDTSCDVLWTLEVEVVEKTDTFSWGTMEKLMLLSVRSPLGIGHF